MQAWIKQILSHSELTGMGHDQRVADANLGLGWIYYGLARTLRPSTAVVIGSWRGFVPMVLARGMADNLEGGSLTFIDPSLVDDFWAEPARVSAWFEQFGVHNISHHRETTQSFVRTAAYRALGDIGLVFIDGYHSREQAEIDFEAFWPRLHRRGVVLFHDSVRVRTSRIYGADAAYEHRVKDYMDELKQRPELQIFDLPWGDGVTLVRRHDND